MSVTDAAQCEGAEWCRWQLRRGDTTAMAPDDSDTAVQGTNVVPVLVVLGVGLLLMAMVLAVGMKRLQHIQTVQHGMLTSIDAAGASNVNVNTREPFGNL